MIRLALIASMAANVATAQEVYISTLEEPLPEEDKVVNAIMAWNDALSIDLRYVGHTNQPCVNNAITYRLPSMQEWQVLLGQGWLAYAAVAAACQPELNYAGVVVLNSPVWAAPSQRIYTHELGHAIGARHVDDPDSIMYAGVVTGDVITELDVRAVIDCTPWLGTDGVLRVPAVSFGGFRYSVQFSHVGNGLWYVTKRESPTPRCIWNYRLPNGALSLWEVFSQGGLYSVRLEPAGVYWRVGEVIKTGEVQQ